MKRSEIKFHNRGTIKFMKIGDCLFHHRILGVPEWKAAGKENEEIVENMLGWDITDFGSGEF